MFFSGDLSGDLIFGSTENFVALKKGTRSGRRCILARGHFLDRCPKYKTVFILVPTQIHDNSSKYKMVFILGLVGALDKQKTIFILKWLHFLDNF